MRTPHNWAYVVSKCSSFYFSNGSLMVGFAISLEIVWIYNTLFFVSNKVLYFLTLQTMHLRIGLPSHLSSPLPFLKNQPNKMGMKLQYLDTIPTSCVVLYTHHKALHTHISLFTATKRMHNYTPTRHSSLLTSQASAGIRIRWSVCLDVAVCAIHRYQT